MLPGEEAHEIEIERAREAFFKKRGRLKPGLLLISKGPVV